MFYFKNQSHDRLIKAKNIISNYYDVWIKLIIQKVTLDQEESVVVLNLDFKKCLVNKK